MAASAARGDLFQHLDASAPNATAFNGSQLIWLDQSGNNRNAVETSSGSGDVTYSADASVFPTGLSSIRFDGSSNTNFGRLELFSAATSDAVLNQSDPSATGFTVLAVIRGDTNPAVQDWNDLIGNTTDVGEGAFLMRYHSGSGTFQGALGGLTVQNNYQGQSNYDNGVSTVFAFRYDPAQSNNEITLASTLNNYTQVFNLSNSVTNRDFSNNDPFTLGKAWDNVGRLFIGNVGEVKIYDHALNTFQFSAEIESLDRKWNTSPEGRLDLVVDLATGNATLSTPGSIPVDVAGLRIQSDSGSLDTSDWLSITDNYDSDSSETPIDSDNTWLKLEQSTEDLSEATFGTTSIMPGQSVNLGSVLRLGSVQDITAEYADPITEDAVPIFVRYTNSSPANLLPGDFNGNGSVDLADYVVWRNNLGAEIALDNEVVSIGRVTTDDYTTWKNGFGASAVGAVASIQVPEPCGLPIVLLPLLACALKKRAARAAMLLVSVLLLAGSHQAHAIDAEVGVYYYPWWDIHDWNDSLRARMLPEDHRPIAGYSPSSSPDLITEHINQSHRGNISMWATSWWGPGTIEDTVLQQSILTHPRASELSYAVHYESTGRFGSFDNPDFSNLSTDFEYLAENVFSDPNYHRIDNRPVVFMYVSRAYFNHPDAGQALANARQLLQDNYGYDPYVVGDEIFNSSVDTNRTQHFDAVTTYDVYAMSGTSSGTVSQEDIQQAYGKYAQAASTGATVIPAVTPGYNDKVVRPGNTPTGRYFTGETIEQAGSVFSALLNQAAAPNVDASTGNLIMVNSFNEWHEDTQIEPTIVVAPSSMDNSGSGTELTQGKTYEGYGYKYLDLLRDATIDGGPLLIDGDADFDGNLDMDDVTAFAAAWGSEHLVNGQRVGGYQSRITLPDFNYDGVVDFEDWFVMRRTIPQASSVDIIALSRVSEPHAGWLAAIAIGVCCMASVWKKQSKPTSGSTLSNDRAGHNVCNRSLPGGHTALPYLSVRQ
ncbi:DUF5010 domain-containing protein [Aeoliella sp.]|uniref:DUF5010 domain-containing protein n=1 Tax=Aeoliella sp. TaxID=2795800 RepID=UPI003CCC3D28